MTVMKVGMIGTGAIAPAYVRGMALFPDDIQLVACADVNEEKAKSFAEEYSLIAMTVDELLASDDVKIVLNLTIPVVHASVSQKILQAKKHVYCEKPLAVNLADGQAVIDMAQEMGLRVGCAPDTFLGAGGQTARRVLAEGEIGRTISATAFFQSPGPDSWHPNPFFYYTEGGGPMLDMGPYYVTALVNLFGPAKRVTAMTGVGFDNRIAGHETVRGKPIPVSVNTHTTGVIEFENGALATLIMSFDTWQTSEGYAPRIEVHGTEGSMVVPDPNHFKGDVKIWKPNEGKWQIVESQHRDDVQRGTGVADMARSIQTDTPHRASGEVALHVLEVMLAFEESARQGQHVSIVNRVPQPDILPENR